MAGGTALSSPLPQEETRGGGGETKIKWEITRLVREGGTVRWGCEGEGGRTNKTVIRVKKWGASAAKNTKEEEVITPRDIGAASPLSNAAVFVSPSSRIRT